MKASLILIGILVVIGILGYLGMLDPIMKDWKRSLRHAIWYMAAMGTGLHLYWLYLIVTNI